MRPSFTFITHGSLFLSDTHIFAAIIASWALIISILLTRVRGKVNNNEIFWE
jgi:hypothetical protein